MRKNGYQIGDDWEPVYSYSMGTEHYEVHTELLDSNINERLDYRAYDIIIETPLLFILKENTIKNE